MFYTSGSMTSCDSKSNLCSKSLNADNKRTPQHALASGCSVWYAFQSQFFLEDHQLSAQQILSDLTSYCPATSHVRSGITPTGNHAEERLMADALSEFSRSPMIVGFAGIITEAGEAFETETATPDTFFVATDCARQDDFCAFPLFVFIPSLILLVARSGEGQLFQS